jgi:hypothetical protein
MYGCWGRPACGKVCKLVCGTTKLVAVGYGCECDSICIPGRSQQGCKHCSTTCCCDNDIEGCPPKIEFCWYDWITCGCARPRNIRVLTKYQAEKEICSYHWVIVDACDCGCGDHSGTDVACDCVYKEAPADAQLGDVLELSQDERAQLTSWAAAKHPELAASLAATASATQSTPIDHGVQLAAGVAASAPAGDESERSVWQRVAGLWTSAVAER